MGIVAKATGRSRVAGWTNGIHQYQQGIVITVRRNVHHIQKMARTFAFGPQTSFGPREEGDFATFQRFRQRVLVHIPQHQYFAGDRVLHHGGQQSVGFSQSSWASCSSVNIPLSPRPGLPGTFLTHQY
jgi:hypothetical protein